MQHHVLALVLVVGCTQAPQPIDRVVVRDSSFQVLRTIDDPASLARFTELWRTRQETESTPGNLSNYPFKLDIAASGASDRWLYRPDGFATPLSVKSRSGYFIPEAHSLNALLGLAEDPDVRGPQ